MIRGTKKRIVVCPDCGQEYPVYRKNRKKDKRGAGHIKTLWCFNCKDMKKFEQLPYSVSKYTH